MHEKILLIDNEEDYLEMAAHILESEGYDPLKAKDTTEALDLINKHDDLRLIMLDIIMPGEDGWSFAKRLKKIKEASHIPRMFVTADPKIFHKPGREKLVQDFLTKPFDIDEFLRKVRVIINPND